MPKRLQSYKQAKRGLGSDIELVIVAASQKVAERQFRRLWIDISAFEARFSRFQASSELSRVNAHAGLVTSISPDFKAVMDLTLEAAEWSDNIFNPLILPGLQRAGYRGSWPSPEQVDSRINYEDRELADPARIQLTDTTIRLPPNTALDLGGCGKGILLDRLASSMPSDLPDYWFSLGGDVITSGHNADGSFWKVGIADARITGQLVTTIPNTAAEKMAVATSGVIKRRGEYDGEAWHHLIDPRNGRPAETDVLTATVIDPSGLKAEILAKTFVIIGRAAATQLIERRAYYAILQ